MANKERHSERLSDQLKDREGTKNYVRQVRARAAKAKHPKGFGTDKERRKKGVWYEVRCDIHGSATSSSVHGEKYLRMESPGTRFNRNVRGCPICYHTRMRAA